MHFFHSRNFSIQKLYEYDIDCGAGIYECNIVYTSIMIYTAPYRYDNATSTIVSDANCARLDNYKCYTCLPTAYFSTPEVCSATILHAIEVNHPRASKDIICNYNSYRYSSVECRNCPIYCLTCTSGSYCTLCKYPYILTPAHSCTPNSGDTYFMNITQYDVNSNNKIITIASAFRGCDDGYFVGSSNCIST